MIVHYNPETFAITGISGRPYQNNPWIDSDDDIVMKIFEGKEKVLNYIVIVKSKEKNQGFLKKKNTINKLKRIDEKLYLIPKKKIDNAEVTIIHSTLDKSILITLSESAIYDINIDNIVIAACVPNDPFQCLWSVAVPKDSSLKFNYQGTDNICFYTEKIFESYSYEQIT